MLHNLGRIINLVLSFVLFPEAGYRVGDMLVDNICVAELIPEWSQNEPYQNPLGSDRKVGMVHNSKKFQGSSSFCPYIPLPIVYKLSLRIGEADLGKFSHIFTGLPF